MVLGFFALTVTLSAVAVTLVAGPEGRGEGRVVRVAIFGVILLVAGFAFIGRSIRRMTRPVGDVMDAADRVAGGDYSVRVEERGPGEMRRLARSFNEMTERLGASEDQRRNLLADLAHELRTPLSVIRGSTEAMLDGVHPLDREHLEPLLDETAVMGRLLDDLQTLSTAEAGALRLHREEVEPARLVEDAVAAFAARADTVGVALRREVSASLPPIEADPVRIGEVLGNLLTNALRHTPRGGMVVASAEAAEEGVAFAIRDSGPGIDPDVLPHVFDRFVKAADSGGHGLGLAIARSLIRAHGGDISAENPPEGGTTIRFVLPGGVSPSGTGGPPGS
jgi:two-component system OmpR family sensor kinase/two-component system sensor histidine kinase BaeS